VALSLKILVHTSASTNTHLHSFQAASRQLPDISTVAPSRKHRVRIVDGYESVRGPAMCPHSGHTVWIRHLVVISPEMAPSGWKPSLSTPLHPSLGQITGGE
jgi:hypothetical protein